MRNFKLRNIFLKNIVFIKGLILAPVIVAAHSLQNAFVITATFTLVTFLSVLCSYPFSQILPFRIRPIVNAVLCTALYIPIALYLDRIMPEAVLSVGIMLPLSVLNTFVLSEEYIYKKGSFRKYFLNLLIYILGFNLTVFAVSFIREFFGSGTIWGYPAEIPVKMSVLTVPAGGFIICGIFAAAFQKYRFYKNNQNQNQNQSHTEEKI